MSHTREGDLKMCVASLENASYVVCLGKNWQIFSNNTTLCVVVWVNLLVFCLTNYAYCKQDLRINIVFVIFMLLFKLSFLYLMQHMFTIFIM